MSNPSTGGEIRGGAGVPEAGSSSTSEETGPGLPGELALASGMAGGAMAGGVLVGVSAQRWMAGSSTLLLVTSLLFLIGTVLGFVHGAVLGLVGRPPGQSVRQALRSILRATLLAVPGGAAAWLVAYSAAVMNIAVAMGQRSALPGLVLSWLLAAFLVVWALERGAYALGHAVGRWPEVRSGAVVLLVTFLFFVIVIVHQPRMWGAHLWVGGANAVVLALGATLWIVAPLLIGVLHLLSRRSERAAAPQAADPPLDEPGR